jgi:hypothetical protein
MALFRSGVLSYFLSYFYEQGSQQLPVGFCMIQPCHLGIGMGAQFQQFLGCVLPQKVNQMIEFGLGLMDFGKQFLPQFVNFDIDMVELLIVLADILAKNDLPDGVDLGIHTGFGLWGRSLDLWGWLLFLLFFFIFLHGGC